MTDAKLLQQTLQLSIVRRVVLEDKPTWGWNRLESGLLGDEPGSVRF